MHMNIFTKRIKLFEILLILTLFERTCSRKFRVIQEKAEGSLGDPHFLTIFANTYKLNRTINGINITAYLMKDLTVTDEVRIRGKKWTNNEYRLGIVQFGNTIRNILSIKYFDMQTLFHEFFNPPLDWPVKAAVYRAQGWHPDSSKFPDNFPEGRWKMEITLWRQKICFTQIDWYFQILYDV